MCACFATSFACSSDERRKPLRVKRQRSTPWCGVLMMAPVRAETARSDMEQNYVKLARQLLREVFPNHTPGSSVQRMADALRRALDKTAELRLPKKVRAEVDLDGWLNIEVHPAHRKIRTRPATIDEAHQANLSDDGVIDTWVEADLYERIEDQVRDEEEA
jgi:hypothetical protein